MEYKTKWEEHLKGPGQTDNTTDATHVEKETLVYHVKENASRNDQSLMKKMMIIVLMT
jgi:hypothetical protein